MKKTIIAILLCIGIIQLSHAQAKLPGVTNTTVTKEEQELLDLSKAKWQWMANKSVDTLSGFLKRTVFLCIWAAVGVKPRS